MGNKAVYNALRTELKLPASSWSMISRSVFLCEILEQTELDRTLINVITKSGTTAETMAGYMILTD